MKKNSYKIVVLKDEQDVIKLYSEEDLNEGLVNHIKKDFRAAKARRRIIYGVELNGEVVATIQLVLRMRGREGVADGKNVAFLHHGRVREDARGEGVGTFMIEFLVDEAREMGFNVVMLSVLVHNVRAIRLYNRIGFSEAARMEAKNGKELIRMMKKI